MNKRPVIQEETKFPKNGTAVGKMQFIMQYAVLAPSILNTQPWQFALAGDAIELYADRSRQLAIADPAGRELIMSCGAALEHVVVAIRHFGHDALVEDFPDSTRPELLARVRMGEEVAITADDALLFYSLHRRHTHREKFTSRAISGEMAANLITAAANSEVWIEVIDGPARRAAMADLIAEADLAQSARPEIQKEEGQWHFTSREQRDDGVPQTAAGDTFFGALLTSIFHHKDSTSAGRAEADRQMALASPTLIVIGTNEDDSTSWLLAGRALARLLLRARSAGIYGSFLSQITRFPETRKKLAEIAGNEGCPQAALRLGYAPPSNPITPRRGVENVMRK